MTIECRNLSKRFSKIIALDDISLSIKRGEIFGYVGENGAGKTTTIRLFTGLLSPSSGKVTILGEDPYNSNYVRRKFGCVLETNGLYETLSIEENLLFYASFYRIKNTEARKIFYPLLERFNLLDRKKDKVGTLSKGMKQKIALIRALTPNPKILFLDEPTAALDPISQQEVRGMIKQYAGSGMTIFFSSHNLYEVEGICDRVGILKKARLLTVDTVSNLSKKFGETCLEISIRKEEIERASFLIKTKYPSLKLEKGEDKLCLREVTESLIPQINKMLVSSDISVGEIKMKDSQLEKICVGLIKERYVEKNT